MIFCHKCGIVLCMTIKVYQDCILLDRWIGENSPTRFMYSIANIYLGVNVGFRFIVLVGDGIGSLGQALNHL